MDQLEEISDSFPVDAADTVSCSDGDDVTMFKHVSCDVGNSCCGDGVLRLTLAPPDTIIPVSS